MTTSHSEGQRIMKHLNRNVGLITSMSQGFVNTYLLYAACQLDLFDRIKHGCTTSEMLAGEAGIEKTVAQKLLRPLTACGMLKEDDGRYLLTEAGDLLTEDADHSLKGYVLYCGGICAKSWSVMAEAARRKETPYAFAMGSELFTDNGEDSGHYNAFDTMMNFVSSNMELSGFLEQIGSPEKCRIVDIGGGTGAVLSQFLRYFPNADGEILDLGFVREKAMDTLERNGLEHRSSFRETDFFKSFEVRGDLFLLSRVLHDWQDEDAVKIIRNIRSNMDETSVLYVIELLIPEETEWKNMGVYMNDLQIWAVCGGTERKLSEYSCLFEKAGLFCTGQQKLPSGETVMEVRTAGRKI